MISKYVYYSCKCAIEHFISVAKVDKIMFYPSFLNFQICLFLMSILLTQVFSMCPFPLGVEKNNEKTEIRKFHLKSQDSQYLTGRYFILMKIHTYNYLKSINKKLIDTMATHKGPFLYYVRVF